MQIQCERFGGIYLKQKALLAHLVTELATESAHGVRVKAPLDICGK
jgi:hypothetical protein